MEIPGYRDLTVLGRGGFSTVYRALQESVQREVALKVLTVHMAGADAKARFRRECATNGRVGTHPNIVTLFDSGFADDGSPYLAMQLCTGGSLSERLRAFGPLPVSDVLRIGVKISAALQYAHSAGVLHRDIKPENILISDFGEPELADFGISSVDDQKLSTVTASSFTINHAAPEALAGSPSSVASDIYSLSSTLFTLVAGHTPFTAPSSTALVALVNMVMNTPAPATGRADVPASLERLLAAGLSKTPAGRPVDAKAVGSALQQIQQELGLPVTEFPSAPPPLAFSPTQTLSALGNGGSGGTASAASGAVAGGADVAAAPADSIDTGDLPPTGALPAEPVYTGDLPPTGAMHAPPIYTGDLPASGAVPAQPIKPGDLRPTELMSPVPGPAPGTDPRPGNWGAWAAERSEQPSAAGTIGAERRPQVPVPPLPPAVASRSTAGDRPRRNPWWFVAIVLAVLLVGTGVYFLAIRQTADPSARPGTVQTPANSSGSTSKSTTPTKSTPSNTTRSNTTSPAATTPSTPPPSTTAAAPAPVIESFGSTSYSNGGEVDCPSSAATVPIPMTWNTADATQAWFAIDAKTGDVSAEPYESAPTAAGPGNGPTFSIPFACSAAQHTFTLTVSNASGSKKSKSITLIAKLTVTSSSTSSTSTTATPSSSTPSTTSTTSSTTTSNTTTTSTSTSSTS